MRIDRLDADLIALLTDSPQLPVMECARRLGVARGTVTSRLARLHAAGVIDAIVPRVRPEGLGYNLLANVTVQVDQRVGHIEVEEKLADSVPEIIDMYTISGDSDLQLRLACRGATDLQRVIDRVISVRGVMRVSTSIVMRTHFIGRTRPLLEAEVNRQQNAQRAGQNAQ